MWISDQIRLRYKCHWNFMSI